MVKASHFKHDKTVKPEAEYNKAEAVFNEQGMSLVSHSTKSVETAADAMQKAGLDPAYWRVTKAKPRKWTVPVKRKSADGSNTIEEIQCWAVSVECVPRMPEHAFHGTKLLIDRLTKAQPNLPKIKRKRTRKGRCLLELSLADVHAGKLASGGGWSLREFERVFLSTFEYFIDKCAGKNIAEIVVPIGNDLLNVDTEAMTTTAGTPQNGRVSHKQMYASVQWALIGAIERCREVAPTKVLHVPGNHDWSSSQHLCMMLDAVFREASDVTVDLDIDDVFGGGRKYHASGNVLIGFSHGNDEKPDELPGIMSNEVPQLWAKSTCREFHIGHRHFRQARKRVQAVRKEMPYHEHHGVLVRQLPSISPNDSWHKRKGYVGAQRMNEAFLYDLNWGIEDAMTVSYERIMSNARPVV